MKPEVKARWLEALRSGRYKQARDALRTVDGGFCCLGVLCDLAAEAGIGSWEDPQSTSYRVVFRSVLDSSMEASGELLTEAVQEWAGINCNGPSVPIPADTRWLKMRPREDSRIALAELNDDGFSFDQIADLIERHL